MAPAQMLISIITEPLFYAIAIAAVIFLGLAEGGFTSAGTAATPLLALYLPPREAAALLLPILIYQDAISVYVYRHQWSAWNLKVLLPGATVGIALGWLFASYVSDDAIRILIGAIALTFVCSVWLRVAQAPAKKSTALGGLFWGAVAGLASFASQGGGPPCQVPTLQQHTKAGVCRQHYNLFRCRQRHKDRPVFRTRAVFSKEFFTSRYCCRWPC